MNKKLLLAAFLLLISILQRIDAQTLSACTGAAPPPINCAQSCIFCDLNGATGQNNQFLPATPVQTVCDGDIVLSNPRWFGFIAGSTNLVLSIQTSGCVGGSGLEAAVIRDCNKAVACRPGPNPGVGGAFPFIIDNLTIGLPYQLVIDGFNGDVCNFTIQVLSGSTIPPALGTMGPITGLQQVCPNATTTYSITPVANAVTYTWTAPPGSKINGGGSSLTLPATAGLNPAGYSVSVNFGSLGGNVCVSASNACSTPVSACLPVSNTPLAITQLQEETVCYELTPYEWAEEPHNVLYGPGTYNLTSAPYASYLGCDSIVRQTIKILPLNQHTLPLRYLCKDECFTINGLDYCETGTYQEVLQSYQGCDSLLNFTLIKLVVNAVIQQPDTITCAVTSVPLLGAGSTTGTSVFYKWLNSAGQVISNSMTATAHAPGDYQFIVTKVQGGVICNDTALVTVPSNLTPPIADAGPDMFYTCLDTVFQLQGTGSTGSVFTYLWTPLLGGNIVSGQTTLTPVVNATGTYSLVITNNHNGCTAVSNAVIKPNFTPPTVLASGGILNCNSQGLALQVATNTNTPAFAWTGPNNFSSTQQNPVVNVPGNYQVVVTNTNNGCTGSATVTVIQYTNVFASIGAAQNPSCFGMTDGSLSVLPSGGDGNYNYQWSNGATTAVNSNLGTGTYFVTVSDGFNCTASVAGTVTAPTLLVANASATPQTGLGNADGTATANPTGGTAPFSYAWSTGETTPSIAGLLPGVYTVTVTDQNGCTDVKTVNVSQYNCTLQTQVQVENVTCHSAANGTATLNITGGSSPFVIVWSTGETTASINNLPTGTYTVSITDAGNCPEVQTFTITEPDTLTANATTVGTSGPNVNDGSAGASPTGGAGNYSYVWSNGETTPGVDSLAAGTYTVTVTDFNGCVAVQTVEVEAGNCNLLTSFLATNPACNGGGDGNATILLTGGAGGFTFLWSSGGTGATELGLGAGTHFVTVTDLNGCSIVDSAVLTDPVLLTLAVESVQNTSCATTPAGSATVLAAGGTGALSIEWPDGQTGATAVNLTAGNFVPTVTDENGCTATVVVAVLSQDLEAPVITAASTTVGMGSSGVLTLTLQNMNATVTDNCVVAVLDIQPSEFLCSQLGDHQVTITATDDAGNSTSQTITVTVTDNTAPLLDCSPDIYRCFGDNTVLYQAPTATDNCLSLGGQFDLVQGLSSGSVFPQGQTDVTYTFTDAGGNIGSCTFSVIVLDEMSIVIESVVNDTNNQNSGSINITPVGGLAPYSFVWTLNGQPFATTEDLTGIGAGTYEVVVTDSNNCGQPSESVTVAPSGTSDPENLAPIMVFPNPTSGHLSVVLPDNLDGLDLHLQLFDYTGRRVLLHDAPAGKRTELDLAGLSDGMYSLVVRVEGMQWVRKVVLNR